MKPIQKCIIKPFGTIPLTKDKKLSEETLKLAEKKLRENNGVGMLPEGRWHKDLDKTKEFIRAPPDYAWSIRTLICQSF
ncbi:MAG: hypothetical protein ACTSU2_09055 [Promethearchaeota archaeon]